MENSEIDWATAQQWEKDWWGDCNNTFDEERKQLIYAKHMGLTFDSDGYIDLQGKSVLDVGGGPVSLLLRTKNGGRRTVVDPLDVPEWIKERYSEAGIELEQKPGEEIDATDYDEVWIYNVLQHTMDPAEVLKNAKVAGNALRIYEWTKTGVSEGHLHDLKQEFLAGVLGVTAPEEVIILWGNNTQSSAFSGYFDWTPAVVPVTIDLSDRKVFHIPSVPHTQTSKLFLSCAFTQKVLRLADMLTNLGHTVYHYGCEGSEVNCTEDISVVSNTRRRKTYPDNEDMTKQFTYDTTDAYHEVFHSRTVKEIQRRLGDRDFLLCPWGWGSKPVVDALGTSVTTVESGIGYPDTFAPFRVFESYTWMMHVYGRSKQNNGNFYDAVIPNYFDLDDFEYREQKGDYFLYLGRIVKRKGLEVAVEMTRQLGAELVIAGQGGLTLDTGEVLEGDHINFVGHADVVKRKELLAGAKALICPTYYIGPFEGVSIEAMLSGTPVISTDWGVFGENNLHGITGYRCRTLEQFVWAGRNIGQISPKACREWAVANFSCERVAKMYEEYFGMLYGLHGPGWPAPNEGRTELDWLNREYPS
jgi:glycosyltransferase involved in cell wall biosynthesis